MMAAPMEGEDDTIRILHVDDDPAFAELTATRLHQADDRFAVESATSAAAGLETLGAGSIDCIISDYDMPGRDGLEFLEAVRAEHPKLPFILYTGMGSEAVAAEAITAGVTDYLQKGSGTEEFQLLATRIRNAVNRYRLEREAATARTQLQAIADHSGEAVLLIDADRRIRYANRIVEAYFGHSPADLRGEPVTTVIPAQYVEAQLTDPAGDGTDGAQTGPSARVEFTGRHRDGTDIPLELSWSDFELDGEQRFLAIVRNRSEASTMAEVPNERERRLRHIAESISEVVWMTDPDKQELLYVNPAYERVWGRSVASLAADPTSFLSAIHPDDRARVEAALDSQATGDYDEEYRIIRPDGVRRWVHDRAVPIENDAGEVDRIVGVVSDITDRKAAERERERIIDRVTDAIVEVNADWEFTLVNDNAEALYDMDRADLLGRSFWTVFEAARGTRFETEYRRVMATREPTSFVEYFGQLDGWFDVTVYPKRAGGLAFYFVDVSEERSRQRELEEANSLLSTLFDTLPVGVLAEDADRNVIAVNDRMAELFDLPGSPAEAIGKDCTQMAETVGDMFLDPDRFVTRIDELVRTRSATDGEELRLQDGRTFERDYRPIELSAGTGHLWVYEDITDLKERERSLQRERDRLDEFAGVVSHDLRNPLSVAEGRLELAQTECESEHLDVVRSALNRMERITEDVLWLAREGRDIGSTDLVRLTPAVDAAWAIATDRVTAASLRYADAEFKTVAIEADADRLRQLLENLFANAIGHGGDDVTVTVGTLNDGFYVADDGPGIPPDRREDVFAAGYTTGDAGTGFGLTIVKQIAEAHGWEIRVTDGPQGGARFELTGVTSVGAE